MICCMLPGPYCGSFWKLQPLIFLSNSHTRLRISSQTIISSEPAYFSFPTIEQSNSIMHWVLMLALCSCLFGDLVLQRLQYSRHFTSLTPSHFAYESSQPDHQEGATSILYLLLKKSGKYMIILCIKWLHFFLLCKKVYFAYFESHFCGTSHCL